MGGLTEAAHRLSRYVRIMPPTDPIGALRASHENLRSVVTPLDADGLRARGYPSEWSIAQVLSHIGSGAEINLKVLDAALAGRDQPGQESNQEVWDRWNAKSPDDQAADALVADAALLERIEANAGSTVLIPVWGGDVDVPGLAAYRLAEHAAHTWDVEVTGDPAATLHPAAVPFVLGAVERLAAFVAKPAGWTGVVHVATTAPGREYALEIGDPTTLTAWDGATTADATLTLPAEAFARLVYGRLDADHTPAEVTATGIDLDVLRATYPGF